MKYNIKFRDENDTKILNKILGMVNEEGILTAYEVANILKLGVEQVYRFTRAGRLKCLNGGLIKSTRKEYYPEHVLEFLVENDRYAHRVFGHTLEVDETPIVPISEPIEEAPPVVESANSDIISKLEAEIERIDEQLKMMEGLQARKQKLEAAWDILTELDSLLEI